MAPTFHCKPGPTPCRLPRRAWCKPEFVVRFEFPAEGILRLARERGIDLIVMGVRKAAEGGLPDHLPWPVASRVVAEAPCPVLTVRG